MVNAAPGPINFTMFLTMFGEKLNGTDPEDVIRNAFACFDEDGTGKSIIYSFSHFFKLALVSFSERNFNWFLIFLESFIPYQLSSYTEEFTIHL